jgi:hypothetical protein
MVMAVDIFFLFCSFSLPKLSCLIDPVHQMWVVDQRLNRAFSHRNFHSHNTLPGSAK